MTATTTHALSCGTCGQCVAYSQHDPACNPWANIVSAIVRLHMQERYGICEMDGEHATTVPLDGAMDCSGDFWEPR